MIANRIVRGLAVAIALASIGAARAQDERALGGARAVERDLVDAIARASSAFVLIGGGSGIIVSPEGDILTNHHVAGSKDVGQRWVVRRPGGVIARAKIIGMDPRGDIALLRLEGTGPFPYVEMADSDQVQTGDAVFALGNPFGFSKDGSPHATVGVVSGTHRFKGGYSDAIQTDAAINPGNSGGPLLDMQGRLIGINGQISVRFGVKANTGVGYAIPSNQIRLFLPQFREKGIVHHGAVVGVTLRDTPAGGEGALVERVGQTTLACQRGLRVGDLIVEAGGRPVNSPARFLGIVGTYPAGASVSLVVRRGGETLKLDVSLDARVSDDGGVVASKGAFLGVRMSTHATGGAEVEMVVNGSPAERAGVTAGDVIKVIRAGEVRHEITDVRALVQLLGGLEPGTAIKLTLARGEQALEVDVTLGDTKKP